MAELELEDIQGIIISGYRHLAYSRYLFLQIKDPLQAKEWLRLIIPQAEAKESDLKITTANWETGKPTVAVNLAFTFLGLQKLELPCETLHSFAEEFREGMAAPIRARLLGDLGESDPTKWELKYRMGIADCYSDKKDRSPDAVNCHSQGNSHKTENSKTPECHLLLILQAGTKEKLEQLYDRHEKLMQGLGVTQLHPEGKEWSHLEKVNQLPCEEGYSSYKQGIYDEKEQENQLKNQGQQSHREHFGFQDNISQPEIEGSPALAKKLIKQPFLQQDVIRAGEFILGYFNEDNALPATPTLAENYDKHQLLKPSSRPYLRDLGRNGSYLVFRKLAQNVAAFRDYIQKHSTDEAEQKYIAAKMVGRWQSGAPLVLHAKADPSTNETELKLGQSNENIISQQSEDEDDFDRDYEPENRFDYRTTDPHGLRCPLGAHIRRVNPRDSLGKDPQVSLDIVKRHRILRRGVLYGEHLPEGESDRGDRGILFICINADIKRQFEFIQTMWINNSKFSGLDHEIDPLLGNSQNPQCCSSIGSFKQGNYERKFTIQKQPVRQRLLDLPDFVTLRGGGYFFLPSISALHFLATFDQEAETD